MCKLISVGGFIIQHKILLIFITMNRPLFIGLLAIVTIFLVSCSSHDDVATIPAYLHLDKISVTHNSDGSTSSWGDGWLTYDVDAAQIELWFENEDTTTRLGTYELPCNIPVLTKKRRIEKIQIYPFVKQNGIAATHIYYPYYQKYVAYDVPLAPDSVTHIGAQDSTGQWGISVPYYSAQNMDVKVCELFEPQQMSITLDSNVTRVINEDARSGLGFGRATLKSTDNNKTFFIKQELAEFNPSSYLYLEMDYRTDMMLTVSMESSFVTGGTKSLEGVVTLYATDNQWNKIYINLGRTWKYFNYNPKFRIGFTALNTEKIDGNVDIDNLKVLSI